MISERHSNNMEEEKWMGVRRGQDWPGLMVGQVVGTRGLLYNTTYVYVQISHYKKLKQYRYGIFLYPKLIL